MLPRVDNSLALNIHFLSVNNGFGISLLAPPNGVQQLPQT